MNSNNEILTELSEIAPSLVPLQKLKVFTVPEGYFDTLAEFTLTSITGSNYEVLPRGSNLLMQVPEGYFNQLADNILQRIKLEQPMSAAQELKELSPALAATGNDNVFTVPRNYFQDFPEIILQSVKPAKVVRMSVRSSFARYAAAAVITGILGLGIFTSLNQKGNSSDIETNLIAVQQGEQILANNSFDKVLATISSDDIVSYLKSTGEDVDAALVASTIDSEELPAADTYLTDDNALNNLLNELDIDTYQN